MPTLSSSNSTSNHRNVSPLPPRINTTHNHSGLPFFNSIVSQVTGVENARARFHSSISTGSSPASSMEEITVDDVVDTFPPPAPRTQPNTRHVPQRFPFESARTTAPSTLSIHHSCDSCSDLETEFAAAVLFVESYQGPHRILQQEQSAPKIGLYALYQQATVGPCTNHPPSSTASPLKTTRYEKWKSLGHMTRPEAMKQYTTVLDNLVDDWRRSAGLGKPTTTTVSAVGPTPPRSMTSLLERLPRIYEECGELQERVEEETVQRQALEQQLVHFTQDQRALFSREMRQVDQMRAHLTTLVQSLEEDVAQHYNELQQTRQEQLQLQLVVNTSIILSIEQRIQQIGKVVHVWLASPVARRIVALVLCFRLWILVRRRRLPQFIAQVLIKWLSIDSSSSNTPQLPK